MENRHFTVIVAGNEPDTLIGAFDSNIKYPPYVVYLYSKAGEYRKQKIDFYEKILNGFEVDDKSRDFFEQSLEDIKNMDDMEFYLELTEGLTLDEKTGNAMSTENPDGKYNFCSIARKFALPFILKDGTESYSAKKKDIDWAKIHLANTEPYEIAWDTVMEGKKPTNEEEEKIYLNMKERKFYFSLFGDRETYIKSSTAFWGYAFLSKKEGWKELDGTIPQFEWVSNFYDKFIKPLPENTLITIYECIRN